MAHQIDFGIKPFLSPNYTSLTQNDITNLVKAIIKYEYDIIEHDDVYDQFFTSMVALAADGISAQCNSIFHTQMDQVTEATSILIRFLLNRLENSSTTECKILLGPLKSLCEGKSTLNVLDITVLMAMLKNAKHPETTKSPPPNNEKDSPKSEGKRSRSDLSCVIMQQLTTPLQSGTYTWTPLNEEQKDCSQLFTKANISCLQALNAGSVILNVCTSLPILSRYRIKYEESALQGKNLYLPLTHSEATIIKNALPQMSADILILYTALSIPAIEPLTPNKIIQLSQCAMSSLYCAVLSSIYGSVLALPTTGSGKSATQQQPTSSPSTSAQAQKETTTAEGESSDYHATLVVNKALEIFVKIGNIFKNSTRSHIFHNHFCMGAWLLITGIQGAMGASGSGGTKQPHHQTPPLSQPRQKTHFKSQTADIQEQQPSLQIQEDQFEDEHLLLQEEPPQEVADLPELYDQVAQIAAEDKGKSPSKSFAEVSTQQLPCPRVNLFKVQQGFGVLNDAIATLCLALLTELIDDLKVESRSGDDEFYEDEPPEPAGFDILGQYTSMQRVIRVLSSATLQQMLTFLATVSYRKACALRRANTKNPNDDEPISFSDSTTYFNETFMCSQDSETEEEDSESYLGLWFKETLSPEGNEDQTEQPAQDAANENGQGVTAKDEPHEYFDLAAQIFTFLDSSLGANHHYLCKYVKNGLSEQQIVLLANILKDLDRDAARSEMESGGGCARWQSAMVRFAGSLGRYLHNLISSGVLNESLQSSLLLHLGVSPWTNDSNWPLQVYPRTLAVLVQILLLKPCQEKEAACLSVWHRLVNTLVQGVCSEAQQGSDADNDDLNVEHTQLLLFLFHNLSLMQKKSILLLTAGGVIRCAEVCRCVTPDKPLRDNQIMLLSRLLLFLEYLMKHLYNPPTNVLEQVRWNLFSVVTLESAQKVDVLNNRVKLISYRKDIEDKYKKLAPEVSAASGVRPKFYTITPWEMKLQQEFKMDGLAWNFILCTPDKLKYHLLIDALIDILSVTDICTGKVPFQTLCAVQYCFSLSWKLILGMAPSTPHVEDLITDKAPNLHSLIWSIRCIQRVSHSQYLIVNSLVKQGMYTQFAEILWNKVTEYSADVRSRMNQTIMGLDLFIKSFQSVSPRLSKVILIDALLSHLNAIYWSESNTKAKVDNNAPSAASTPTNTNVSTVVSPPPESLSGAVGGMVETDASKQPSFLGNITREELATTLRLKILDVIDILLDFLQKTTIRSLCGHIPVQLMESLISITSSKTSFCSDITNHFLSVLTGQDKDVVNIIWTMELSLNSEGSLSSKTNQPVEMYTLSVIDAHLSEVSKYSIYSILMSLKHTLKSSLKVLSYLLPLGKNDQGLQKRLQDMLIPLIFDIRTSYLYETANECLEILLGEDYTSDQYQFLAYCNILKHTYKLVIDYCEMSATVTEMNLDETILHHVFKFWESILEKQMGMKAMHEFFFESKQGSLVNILLSFSNTNMSQAYSTKVLQFFEKLFQAAEQADSQFNLNQLCQCISELGTVDPVKLKTWLSHILLGPGGATAAMSSNNSSNVQTPTNVATVSTVANIGEQIPPPDSTEVVDMEIEDECVVGATGGGTSGWTQGVSITSNRSETPNEECLEKNGRLLQTLTKYIVSENRISPAVPGILFNALIQIGQNLLCPAQDALEFTDLLQVMVTLADAGQGKGHSVLFSAAIDWLEVSKNHVLEKSLNKLTAKSNIALENVSSLLQYMSDLLQGLGSTGSRALSPPWEEDNPPDMDDFVDDVGADDDDSVVEDSDEDSLGNKLCTFSITQKEFMNQHWYHCHTCKMVDGAGVCSVCARVCHKNHDISYAKYGNFFCDCGAKDDGSCMAMSPRTNVQEASTLSSVMGQIIPDSDHVMPSSLRRRVSSPQPQAASKDVYGGEKDYHMAKVIEASKEALNNHEQWKAVVKYVLDFFELIMPAIQENCAKYSTVGCHLRAKNALERLHHPEKTFTISDQIMVSTMGSQEGAFENVRMSYSGEQGQTIRQLLSTNLVRRVALCCLSSPHGKRQHLAVSHEKGKVTILQLSALLKQPDVAKRKLTLNRLSSAPIPCTVLSLASNPANEDFLAVCGLKECHILTFTGSGSLSDHIVLTPQLETGNFIKRAIWLPASQTKLALVTADFVKIYELAEDTYSPQYYFLVPSGKIRDCTFVYQEDQYYMLLMASSGYIYTQPLANESLAKHGPFYVTNTLELDHPHIKDVNGQIGNGGVSIYYSHVLQLLFFSYTQGRNFMAPLVDVNAGVKCVMQLQTGPNTKNSSKGPLQPLCQWTEIPGHPGLVCAMMQTSNNPVIFMLKPDSVSMQEIKATSSKAKIMDMVAIRHSVSGVEKTTLILLCEDGSLRIFSAHPEGTGYWMSPEVQPVGNQFYSSALPKAQRRNKRAANKSSTNTAPSSNKTVLGLSQPTFPIDFFEHCTLMTEVEYGGNDLLQIYNTTLLKHRLNSTGLYVMSSKANGFTLEVYNNDPNMVITGLRVLIGSQDPQRAPTAVTFHGRTVTTIVTRPRWFDLPLTREESLLSDKKLCISFGTSQDPENICMLDSIKIYGKTKDVFGWPEEQDEVAPVATTITSGAQASQPAAAAVQTSIDSDSNSAQTVTTLDRMVSTMLEVLDSGISLIGGVNVDEQIKEKAIEVSTALLIFPTPIIVQNHAKCVLASLHSNRTSYHAYKDKEILTEINDELKVMSEVKDPKNIDPEAFYRLVLMARSIAVTRPQSLWKICIENNYQILPKLMKMMKTLHQITPTDEHPTPIVKRGLSHTEAIVHSIVEIIFAFALTDPDFVGLMTKFFVDLLLDSGTIISHSTKQALIKLLRPRIKRRRVLLMSSPPGCSTPTPSSAPTNAVVPSASSSAGAGAGGAAGGDDLYAAVMQEVDAIESMGLEAAGGASGGVNPQALASLEALLGGLPQMFEMQQEADEEAIMEIAIALSLQDHDGDLSGLQQGLANVQSIQNLRGRTIQTLQALAGGVGGYSNDPSASVGGSDDEGSNAATDGSTLRTSPAEHAGSGGSESGGSGVESIGGTSGRSSTYGDQPNQSPPREAANLPPPPQQPTTSVQESVIQEDPEDTTETENAVKLHVLRYSILDKMIDNFWGLDWVTGTQAVSFMQVILMLTSDLDGSQEPDQNVMQKLLNALIERLEMVPSTQGVQMTTRTSKTEVQWLILRMLSVFMGKVKSTGKSSSAPSTSMPQSSAQNDNATFVASATANALMKAGAIPYCLVLLESFLPYWKNASNSEDIPSSGSTLNAPIVTVPGGSPTNKLLRPILYGPVADMQPFHTTQPGSVDPYENYQTLITEMAVKLPYQILKLSSGHPSSYDWYRNIYEYMTFILCEYMLYWQTPALRRQVRKLLLYVCGNKEKYRQMRDIHALDTHMKAVRKCTESGVPQPSGSVNIPILDYDALVELTEHLRACQEIASVRTGNWQHFCIRVHTDILPCLLRISCQQLDEGVSPIILQLLQSAVCNSNGAKAAIESKSMVKERRDREKSEESECAADSKFDPALCGALVDQIFNQVQPQLLTKFIRLFLLETNSTNLRWQAHSLIYAFYENSNTAQQEQLLNHLWSLWPYLSAYGRRTAQFVDLIGFLTLNTKCSTEKFLKYTEQAVTVLRQQNELLSRHPNAPIYTALGQVLELEGFYLESEPCLVCNNPEVPMTNIKLSSIKIDSKFTTTTIIVKLVQSHTISKITLRIADLKRTKMVRTINIYYNNRTVQAVVELKNRPAMWHKARKVTLSSGQTDAKIDFPLPITACNLMIEYVDFYETVTGSSESLQCPRCSAAVPANPGVCSNCGENVYQCHKCRAINYDEKDPFLCHSCGFCKYAKFDYTIFGRACCAVDPIESADDRAKTVQTIHSSLEKADRIYRQLQANKQFLELLVQKIAEHKLDRNFDESVVVSLVSSSQVNKVIQLLAQKYCGESKASFEDLGKIIQKVQACRRELVAYDRSQQDIHTAKSDTTFSENAVAVNKCYGCALASTEHCLTLLRAMSSNVVGSLGLCMQGLVQELAQNNLRRGTVQIQDEVRSLLCLLTRDNRDAIKSLCTLIHDRVKMALSGTVPLANLDTAVRHELALLEALVAQDDTLWEEKLKTVLHLFVLACQDPRGPAVVVIQPCLRIIETLICPAAPTSKANKDLSIKDLCTMACTEGVTVSFQEWLAGNVDHSYESWKKRMPPVSGPPPPPSPPPTAANQQQQQQTNGKTVQRMFRIILEQKRSQFRRRYLSEKYGKRWRAKVLSKGVPQPVLELEPSWLQKILFNPNSRIVRKMACALVTSLCRSIETKREILNLLTGFLKYIGDAGEACAEFISLYISLADETPWRQYLALKGVLITIADLLATEIEKIHRLEETTLSSDLAQGYALHQLVELMAMFLENPLIRQSYKSKLLGPVLQGYLSLRKLVVQRTRLVDDAQEKLLEMLEEMTTGTEDETRAFMAVLIETVDKTPMNDIKTPVFIFERLCSIIHPEENDVSEFFLTLEKDPQQEDFLQGRMLGNPYPSSAAGLGPLMRDVKNKICSDCELVALLEDDNGMELLVHNKIISLDLPVKDVYKKIWLAEGGERDGMRIVYRMRGLLGDATEEFVETLNNKCQEEVDNEQLYRMANVLADCGGLRVMLDRIVSLQNISRSRSLLQVLLKLFLLSVKVRRCQEVLCQPELGAINSLLKVLQVCLQSDNDSQQSAVTEQLLEIMETILSKAASDTLDLFLQFSLTFGGPEYVQALISCTNCTNVRNNPSVLRHLIRVLAALVYGNDIKMALLCEHFKSTLDFGKFDGERTSEDEFKMELFCVLTNQIEHNSIGGTLKDYIISLEIVERALNYITMHAPCVKPTLLRTDSDELKEFISRPSLKYILRFLTGLATKHEATQVAVSKDIIPIVHRLEQVSSDEHVGSLAENLLEALCTDPATAKRVQEERDFTRAEKKRLAMATREKQLDALGMRTNEKGQVTAKGSILQKIEKLRDETGLSCFICREGYACQPTKVLGIYTFTKRVPVEQYEVKRKTPGYTTVTHFNVVHHDCHMSAIRLARSRDEWESASLQNANTRCNGLLPLWGPEVTEAAFSSSMSRHNAYMQESTQRCEINFPNAIHDLKLLLMRFAFEKSFHEDAGGGGPESNMHLVPYLVFYALYILLSSRSFSREEKTLTAFLGQAPSEKWLECAYDVEGPLYQITLSLALHTPNLWAQHKIYHLKRLLGIAQVRHVSPSSVTKALTGGDRDEKDYSVYKPYLMFWGLADLIYRHFFKTVTTPKEEDWPISLFDYLRRNDEAMLKSADALLSTFTEEYLPCTSLMEFCDVAGLLNDIEDPKAFMDEVLASLP
ncbi:Protein purity of essence [Sergentomyia squamirostris]